MQNGKRNINDSDYKFYSTIIFRKESTLAVLSFYYVPFCFEQTYTLGVSHTPSVQFVQSEKFFLFPWNVNTPHRKTVRVIIEKFSNVGNRIIIKFGFLLLYTVLLLPNRTSRSIAYTFGSVCPLQALFPIPK